MKLYTGNNRDDFRITKVVLATIPEPDEPKILVVYAGDQVLEELVLTRDKLYAPEVKRQLNTELISNSHTDRGFWELWDYYYKRNKV